jgi:hypothetical protein
MKILPLKTIATRPLGLDPEAPPVVLSYTNMIVSVLMAPRPQQGTAAAEMRQILRIADIVEAAQKAELPNCKIENQDWTYLRDRVNAFPWLFCTAEILQFVDDIANAETFDPNAPATQPPAA